MSLHVALEMVSNARGQEEDKDQFSYSLGFHLKDLTFPGSDGESLPGFKQGYGSFLVHLCKLGSTNPVPGNNNNHMGRN